MKHSPGPWKYALAFENNAPNYYAVTNGEWGAPTIAKCTNEADARLITAAPDLLAALEQAQRFLRALERKYPQIPVNSDSGLDWDTRFAVRAALAKARGE